MASTQTRQKRKATLRECSFLCGPIHRKIEVLAAAVAFARCSLGIIFTCNKCATESKSTSLSMSWFLYFLNMSEEDQCKAFRKWLAMDKRAAELFKHQKLAAAWFKAGKDETSRC